MNNPFSNRQAIPAQKDFWNRPQQKDIGSSSIDIIYLSVGKALSSWEIVECSFAKLFGLLVSSGENHIKIEQAAERAYGAITGTIARKQAIMNAAEIYADWHKESFSMQDLKLLCGHYSDAVGRRNDIAHAIVTNFKNDLEDKGYFLVPPFYLSGKNKAKTSPFWNEARSKSEIDPLFIFGHDYRYTHEDINYLSSLFQKLNEHITQFFMEQLMNNANKKFEETPSNQKATIQLGKK